MKKTGILIAALALIATTDSMSVASEIQVDFDRPNAQSNMTELLSKIADYTGKGSVPMPVAVAEGIAPETNPHQDELILLKDLLADILPEMRSDFVSAMHFAGNGITPEGRNILTHAGLAEARINGIAKTLHGTPNEKKGEPLSVSLDILLEGVPADVKRDFADNLKFLNGNVVSAKTDLLEKVVSPEKYGKILDIIMPEPLRKSGTGAATRAKDEACVAYTGAKSRGVLRGCDWAVGYTCNPATCKSSKN